MLLHLTHSFSCPLNATTVRMELKTSSATDPALAYAFNSISDVDVINCIGQQTKALNAQRHQALLDDAVAS